MSTPPPDHPPFEFTALDPSEEEAVIIVLDDDERDLLESDLVEAERPDASDRDDIVVVLPNGWTRLDRVPVVTADLSWIAPPTTREPSPWRRLRNAWRRITGSATPEPLRSPLRSPLRAPPR
ncbi:MAG: hypothetical protein AAF488_10400 [Planctomycetota bacterium]